MPPTPAATKPRSKPALKISLATPTPAESAPASNTPYKPAPRRSSLEHFSPAELPALISQAIRIRPGPRRMQADFYFCCNTLVNPVAPPPTPVDEHAGDDGAFPFPGTPGSDAGETPGSATSSTTSWSSVSLSLAMTPASAHSGAGALAPPAAAGVGAEDGGSRKSSDGSLTPKRVAFSTWSVAGDADDAAVVRT